MSDRHRGGQAVGRVLGAAAVAVLATAACGGEDSAVDVPGLEGAPLTTDGLVVPPVPTTAAPSGGDGSSASVDDSADDSGVATEAGTTEEPETEPSSAETDDAAAEQVDGEQVDDAPSNEPAAEDVFLRRGDEGPDVRSLQQRLITVGYLAASGETGVFDDATADALIDFQAQYGLVVDGVFGPESDRALNAAAVSIDAAAG